VTPEDAKQSRQARDELLRIEGELSVLETAWKGTVADVQANIALTIYRLRGRVASVREMLDAIATSTGGDP